MDHIHIDKLFFRGKHGVGAAERKVEQEFEVSVRLSLDTAQAGRSDKLVDTVDYQKAKDIVGEVIQGSSRYLIEALAEDIATRLLKEERIKSAEITIRKVAVWDNGVPGVTIVRSN
ncbi:MAG TPA: dihydroneopterin aldolase [Candidatus Paceibacterota bacterium]